MKKIVNIKRNLQYFAKIGLALENIYFHYSSMQRRVYVLFSRGYIDTMMTGATKLRWKLQRW